METDTLSGDAIRAVTQLATERTRQLEVQTIDNPRDGGDMTVVAIPKGVIELKDLTPTLDALADAPRRRRGVVRTTTPSSFVMYVNRMKQPNSLIFAQRGDPKWSITAILNYHDSVNVPPAEGNGDWAPVDDPSPQWGDERVHFDFPYTKQFETWRNGSGADQGMSQGELAQHVEANILDIMEPPSPADLAAMAPEIAKVVGTLGSRLGTVADLISVSRGLKVRTTEAIGTQVDLNTGAVTLTYKETHSAGDDDVPAEERIVIPTAFLLSVPIFEGEPPTGMLVQLRYRKYGGAIKWFYEIFALEQTLRHVAEQTCVRLAEETGVPLIFGQAPNPT